MQDRLLSKLQKKQAAERSLPSYCPFKCPPDLKLAQLHRKATKVGKIPTNLSEQLVICPCCDNVINKKQFGLLCDVEEFANIGLGYTLFFMLYKYFTLILLFIFIVSGGAFIFLLNIECINSCIKFFGIAIMSEDFAFSESAGKTQVVHIVTASCILIVIIISKHFISRNIERVQKKIICPSQYTIMVQNLPTRQLNLKEFKKWIYKNLGSNPILINIAYNTDDFLQAKQKREELQIQKNKLIIKRKKMIRNLPIVSINNSLELTNTEVDNQIKIIQRKIQQQMKIIQGYYKNQIQHKEIGTVFVTFNSADQTQKIIQTHERTFFNILLQKLSGFFYTNKLQYDGNLLVIRRAPAPRQVIWQNLQFSYIRNILFDICFVIGMGLFMFLTFRIQFWFVSKMYNLRHEGQLTGNQQIVIQAIMMSLVIMVLNILLRIAIQFLTKLKKSYSYTKQEASFCTYYSLSFILNSCLTIYIVHGNSLESSNRLLLIDIHTIMLTNAFSEPLFKIFDPVMWLKMFQKFRIEKTQPENIPYPQSYIHRLWQGHEISNADNYQYIIRVLFITVWFANIAPLGVLFSLLGMLFDYWIIKFLFIKVYKQQPNLSNKITKCLDSLELLPLVYIGGIMPFLYKITFSLDISMFFNLLFHYGIVSIILLICIFGYLYKFRPKNRYIPEKKYSDFQLAFGFNYETQNPMTKFMGEKKFLEQILKKQRTLETQNLVKNILDESSSQYHTNNPSVSKLKLTLTRKIESKMQQNNEIQMREFSQQNDSIRESIPTLLKRKNEKF